ncbi:type IV toxin-antitoxin system AbiEi family antitoxin domain-containing protein [Legionella sp. 29fVS95]|uniref:type IV toxin-antitoxin system AbiEi family antitoxin domain-containing protein n=1 Tax=Legionella sp. 29fVS95 TaxID=3402813 RepID=UPI003AF5E72D
MARNNETKINYFMVTAPSGVVLTSAWLKNHGVSSKLAWWYVHSGLLEKLGTNAYKKAGTRITWAGAINALQSQLNIPVHVGGKTALHLLGLGHFIPMQGIQEVMLFAPPNTKIPKWLLTTQWDAKFELYKSSLFNDANNEMGLVDRSINEINLKLSSPERAAMELLHLYPNHQSFDEIAYLIENLGQLRPKLVQTLLENCNSIKVKRLFLHLSDQFNHSWFSSLDTTKIDLGKGKRELGDGGKYYSKYKLSLPEIKES